MDWPTVADDAIKIGLGAAIAAVAAYIVGQQNLRLQLRGEYAKRRRDALEKIASEFDQISIKVLERAGTLTALPFGSSEQEFQGVLEFADSSEPGISLEDTSNLHALEARLALLAYSYIAEAIEEYRALATTIALANPRTTDKKSDYEALMDKTHKQRTWIVTMMAEAFQNAHRESFPGKMK